MYINYHYCFHSDDYIVVNFHCGKLLLFFVMCLIVSLWMKENFELNHETLYLAVKITDHYLTVDVVMRESLQLIGSTAMLIAAKFEVKGQNILLSINNRNKNEFLNGKMNIFSELTPMPSHMYINAFLQSKTVFNNLFSRNVSMWVQIVRLSS